MKKKTNTSPASFPKAEIGREMKGADCVVECLIREGVDVIFAYPGGASQELHQSLARTDKIRTILPRHEQGGSFAAEGYARPTGKVGVCMATSGPGATNLLTGIGVKVVFMRFHGRPVEAVQIIHGGSQAHGLDDGRSAGFEPRRRVGISDHVA